MIVISKRSHVRGVRPMRKQTRVNAGIKRLDAPIEYLGETGVLCYFGHFHSALAQQLGGSAGRQKIKAKSAQLLRKFDHTGLVGHAQQRQRRPAS